MMKKTLIIKNNNDDFEKYFNDNIKATGKCKLMTFSDFKQIKCGSTIEGVKGKILNFFAKVKAIKEFDKIIIFDCTRLVLLCWLLKRNNARLILWHWNVVKTNSIILRLANMFCEQWTFDILDAKKYGWKLNTQFYFCCNKNKACEIKQAFFCGLDKGRFCIIKRIETFLKKYNIGTDIHMIGLRGKVYDRPWVKSNFLSYAEVLKKIYNSKILIDIVQPGQVGLTMRVMEAIMLNKKLITNNKYIASEPWYNKNNVYIIGVDSDEDFTSFVINGTEIDEKVKIYYDFSTWLDRFDQ